MLFRSGGYRVRCDNTMPTKQTNTVLPYDAGASHYRLYPWPQNWLSFSSYSSGTRANHSEVITDEQGSDGRFRPCSHEKTHSYFHEPPVRYFSYPTGGDTVEFRLNRNYSPKKGIPSWPSVGTILSDEDWRDLDTVAIGHMLPSLSDSFSLINFLIELKDFRRIIRAFQTRKNRLGEVIGLSDGRSSTIRKSLKKAPLQSLSNSYLQYSFAWRPFVSDIMSMWNKLGNTERELQEIWRRAGKPQTRHYSRILDGYDTDWSAESGTSTIKSTSDNSYRNHRLKRSDQWRYSKVPVYRATCRYTYKVPGALDSAAKLRGWADAFGVRLDPSIIWNAIPFSFLVDWVVDVGGFLRQYSTDNLGLHFSIEDFCSSLKYQIESRRNGYVQYLNTYETDRYPLSTSFKTSYTRRTGIPSLSGALVGSTLSAREISLGGALVLANRRPRS